MSKVLTQPRPASNSQVEAESPDSRPILAIVGCPNVGKSLLFNRITGAYVAVSNYPGTTVEVTRGKMQLGETEIQVVDTPGMYSLRPISEEESVARRLLLTEHPRSVAHVLDARNLQRMLPLTLQLLEAGLPIVLALNMMDEADQMGFRFDIPRLADLLGIPVLATSGATNRGIKELRKVLGERATAPIAAATVPLTPQSSIRYEEPVETAIQEIGAIAGAVAGPVIPLTSRSIALLLLQGDAEVLEIVRNRVSAEAADRVADLVGSVQQLFAQPLSLVITMRRQQVANDIIAEVMQAPSDFERPRLEWLSRILMHPVAGLPALALVLYLGIYQFVGVFGAQTLVNLIENTVFGKWINPFLSHWIQRFLPDLWANLFVGEYGIITLGITYAVAIVLPIVGLFFLVFAALEDSGYLPRLAMLTDRLFKAIGLNGRAVIPIVLGFGCDTMATMVTRVLETKRERLIATLLLALAIPCSAQSGLFLAMLGAVRPWGLIIYVGILVMIFLVVGLLAAWIMPGEKAGFYIELPPLRLPRLSNVLVKTYTRLEWYFVEILPMFILASVVLWIGSLTWNGHTVIFSPHHGVFGWLEHALDPLGALIGLPTSADVKRNPALEFTGGTILLAGFFRRDFGAAGLWHLFQARLISPVQIIVSAVTLTLFLPCVAQFLMMKRERGFWTAVAVSSFVVVVAFAVGFLLKIILTAAGLPLTLAPQSVIGK